MGYKATKEIRTTKLDDFLDRFCLVYKLKVNLEIKLN